MCCEFAWWIRKYVHGLGFRLEDAYWTTGRSVLLGQSNMLHPEKKWLAVDGRVRAVPSKDRAFALFWAITRTQEPV